MPSIGLAELFILGILCLVPLLIVAVAVAVVFALRNRSRQT